MAEKGIKHRPVLRRISIFTTIILILSSLLMLIRLIQVNLIPAKYLISGGVLLVIIDLIFVAISFLRKRHVWKMINIVLAVLISAVFIFASIVIKKSGDSIEKIFQFKEINTTYYVLVNKSSAYENMIDLNGKKVGMMITAADKVKERLNEYTPEYVTYTSIGELVYSMEADNEAIIISKDYYEYLNEEDANLLMNLRKIHEFEVIISSSEVKKQAVESSIDVNNSFIVYLSGVDASNTLSDVNILIVINPDTHKVLLVNTPRDYYVQIAGTTGLREKLTHGGFYGINTQMKTMSELYNVNIDSYIRVNYGAVTTVVNDIGGIEIYSDKDFVTSHIPHTHLRVGNNYLNGPQALAFAQERYAYATGDRHRGQNQEAVITAIIKKVSTNKGLLLKYNEILDDLNPYVITNIDYKDVQEMIKKQINEMPSWEVISISVNGGDSQNYTASYPRQLTYVMEPDQATIDSARSKIMEVMRGK